MVQTGPAYIVDVTMLAGREEPLARAAVAIAGRAGGNAGRWVNDELPDEFVTREQRFVPDAPGPCRVVARPARGAPSRPISASTARLLEMEGPGLPGEPERAKFYVVARARRNPRFITVLETHEDQPAIRAVRTLGDSIEIETARRGAGTGSAGAEWTVEREGQEAVVLRGRGRNASCFAPLARDRTSPPPRPLRRSGSEARRRSMGHSEASTCREPLERTRGPISAQRKMRIPVPTISPRWRTRRGTSRRSTWRWS